MTYSEPGVSGNALLSRPEFKGDGASLLSDWEEHD